MTDYLSYGQLIKDIQNFKKSGTIHGDEFNLYDTPTHKYFKILFYFGDAFERSNEYGFSNGLLHPTWEIFKDRANAQFTIGLSDLNYFDYNSAWSFLKLNDENERAEKLEKFVALLSNINSCSPWYFQSIGGLDAALERKVTDDGNLDLSESKRLTITCLPDAFDNRIGTLLELYRDITWSWINKKEIIPANLRKFDMAIYIYESPLKFWRKDDDIIGNTDSTKYTTSYKLIEFHDCEFIYNSLKSGWSDLNNQTGITPTYNIEISYNDCYEISYNEHLMRSIGDIIETDTYQAIIESGENVNKKDFKSSAQKDSTIQIDNAKQRNNESSSNKPIRKEPESKNLNEPDRINTIEKNIPQQGFLENAIGQVAGHLKADISHKLKRAVLGNLYSYSLTQIGSQIGDIMQGNLIKTGQSVKQYIDNAQERAAAKVKTSSNLGNLFKNTIANN